jgi:hypothetical protein
MKSTLEKLGDMSFNRESMDQRRGRRANKRAGHSNIF